MNIIKISNRFRVADRKRLIIYSAILVVWATLMLTLSSQNGSETAQVSDGFSRWLVQIFFGDDPYEIKFHAVHRFVRKTAHVLLFAVLSALLSGIFNCFENARLILCAAVSVGIAALFAFFDEWHKLFIPGRHFDMFDVMLNIIGGIIGAAFFTAAHYFIRRKREKKEIKRL